MPHRDPKHATGWLSTGALTLLVALALALGCAPGGRAEKASASEARAFMAPFLEGEERFCAEDDDCRSGLCTWGTCVGILSADRVWMGDKIAEGIRAAVAEADVEVADAVAVLKNELGRPGAHVAIQSARILRVWRALDPASAGAAAAKLLGADEHPLLRFEAARLRLSQGDREAARILLDMLRGGRTELVWFLLPEWRFFAPEDQAVILDTVEASGTPELRERLTTLKR